MTYVNRVERRRVFECTNFQTPMHAWVGRAPASRAEFGLAVKVVAVPPSEKEPALRSFAVAKSDAAFRHAVDDVLTIISAVRRIGR
jgi:hypothetical protein